MRRVFGILALVAAGTGLMQAQSIITTVAGNGSTGSTGDGGLAISAQIGSPGGVAVDSNGNIYIADALNNRIRKVDASSGNITTYVGTGGAGFSGDGGPAAGANINLVGTAVHSGIAVDKQGNLYIADTGNNCIRKVTASSGIISTIAGIGGTAAGLFGDAGAAISAKLAAPLGVAVDGNGIVYIADTANGRVRKVDASGTITTVAGTANGALSGDGGLATSAQLFNPDDVAVDASGNVFIADYNNGRVRKVDASGIISSLNVGAASPSVASLAVDNSGNILMTTGSSVVKYIAPGAVSVYAGGGLSNPGDGSTPTSATLGAPSGLALDATGNLYISDRTFSRVRKVTPGATCNFTLSTTSLSAVFSGGSFPITIQTSSGCTWGVPNLPSWITLSGAATGLGNGTVTVVVAATLASRTATFTIGGVLVTVTQAAPPTCSYAISSTGQIFTAAGGMATINVTAPDGCAWDVLGQPDNLTISHGLNGGTGNGFVTIVAFPNTGAALSGFIIIAGLKYAVQQQAAAIVGLSLVGSMPHLPGEMGWSTILTLVNKGSAAATARTNLLAGDGTPMSLPVGLPQQGSLPGPLLASSLDQILSPNASWVMDAGGTTSSTLEGSAQVFANGLPNSVDGFAIFHFDPNNQEAVVPLETRSASSYFVAFDNTNGVQTGMAVANQGAKAVNIAVTVFDDSGNQITTDTVQLMGNGHTSFVLGDQASEKYPGTAGKRGMIQFDTPVGGRISALGIRYTGGTTTTIPALANVTAGSGIMAHLASGDGWQTTFVFVNVGQGTGVATVHFFGDNGQPISLPLTFPQGGSSDALVSSYNTPFIVPQGSWYVQSGGDLTTALLTGSAQVTTTANIGAFVIFRYNPNGQEAVVPLENRNASTYMIAFDNTAGTATGVAVANASSTNISLPYIVRDDSGTTVLDTGVLPLAANGHTSFGLSDFAPVSAGRRGVIEFDAPTGASISVLGIRSPPALTFTTLPALAK